MAYTKLELTSREGYQTDAVGQLNENPVHKYELVVFNIGELDLVVFIDVENEQLVFNDIEKTTSKSLI